MKGFMKRWGWIGAGLLLPVAWLLPFLGGFFYHGASAYTDMAISHYPNALWLQQSIQAGEVPLWSSTILSGTPSSANPLSGLHYPLGWLALLLPLPFGLNLSAVLHLLFAGLGMYLFLRGEGLDRPVALFGAIGYEAMPKLFAHLGAGHLTLVYAAGWTPWLLLAQQAANRRMRRYWMVPGMILGLIFLADPRYAAVAGVVWLAYLAQGWLFDRGEEAAPRHRAWMGLQALGGPALALGLGAVLLIPMLEYVSLSTRSLMTAQDLMTLSLPPVQLLGLLAPNLAGTAEWVLYPGAALLALASLSLALPFCRSKVLFWGGFFLACLIWSLGENLPGLALLVRLPGLNLLRVPPRMMLAGFVGLILMACLGLQAMRADAALIRRLPRFNPLLVLVGLDFLLVLLGAAVGLVNREFPVPFLWGAVALGGSLLLLFLFRAGKLTASGLGIWMVIWLLADTAGANWLGMRFRPTEEVLSEGGAAAGALVNQIAFDYFRVYSPSYSIPQQTAAYGRLELADGIDPLQLISYSQFMLRASGVPSTGYSVTLPPLSNGDPAVDNRAAVPDPRLLGLLNVRYVVAAYPLQVDGLVLSGQYDGTYIYRNEYEMPRAWVQDPQAAVGEGARPVTALLHSANRVSVAAQGPGRLVVSEIDYPGWQATVDGMAAPIRPVAGLLRGVDLPAGDHLVEMVFRPASFYAGLTASLAVGLAGLLAFGLSFRGPHGQQG